MRKIVVKALIAKESGSFLMLCHDKEWDVPGGEVHGKSSTLELIQYVKKQCGLTIEILKPVKMSTYKKNGELVLVVVFLCKVKSGKLKLAKGFSSSKWVNSEKTKTEPDYYSDSGK